MKAALFCNLGPEDPELNRVFGPRLRTRVQTHAELLPHVITRANFEANAAALQEVEIIFATWGMWLLTAEQMQALPNLKAVFYAAGTVKYFAEPLLTRGIVVTSAWVANAIPVAEFTLAHILLANKGFFRNVNQYRETDDYNQCFRGRGNYAVTVSVLGAGQIGRKVIELLRPFHLNTVVYDPFLTSEAAELLGVEKVDSLEAAFSRGDVVSNHLADLTATFRMLRGEHFALLPKNATFINTGRGRTVDHEELLQFLQARPDVTALLDVTDPEPLPLTHPLRALPNTLISGHIAGSIGDEVERMGDFAIEEFERWQRGEPLHYAITPRMLETMA